MVATYQPKAAVPAKNAPPIPVGVDNGHGLLKMVLYSSASQIKIRCPSKFKENREELVEIPQSKEGSIFYYKEGDSSDLIGKEFKTGNLAYEADPGGHIKLSDNSQYKIDFCLHSILGALGTLPYRQLWNLHLVISIHNWKLFRRHLIKVIEGKHIVNFNGKNSPDSFVFIKVSLVVPEGTGSYAYCRSEGLIDPAHATNAIDFGTGTVIPAALAAGGAETWREPLNIGGCVDLLEALASDREIQIYEGGRTGDIEIIRRGIEEGSFGYGSSGINFRAAYEREFPLWFSDRFGLALKALRPWRNAARNFVVWGGGAQLPGMANAVQKYGYTAVKDGTWANAIGLERIAEARLQKGK